MLVGYLQHRDVLCPRCGYNLRNLTQPTCPECREPLSLKVGVVRLPIAGLLAAIVPGAFSLVAVLIFIVMCALHGPPSLQRDQEVWLVVGFLALSAAAAVALACASRWFTKLSPVAQAIIGTMIWLVHVAVFIAVLTLV